MATAKVPKIPEAEAVELLRSWLRDGSLYVRLTIRTEKQIELPETLSQPCSRCSDLQATTWKRGKISYNDVGKHVTLTCVHCGETRVNIWFVQSVDGAKDEPREAGDRTVTFMKIGQAPEPPVRVSPALRKALKGQPYELYRRGLVCLNHGYGIAALAYLRRVVEDTVGTLLELIEDLRPGDEGFARRVEEARKSIPAKERLRLIAELVPKELFVGDSNPFEVLYDNFSSGLHGESDEQCAEIAAGLRHVFEHVHNSVAARIREDREFDADMKKWREKGKRK